MRRTEWLQETRMRRFEETYEGWQKGQISQQEAARLLGVCDRTFRRYIVSYNGSGLNTLVDKRLCQVSHRRASMDEVMKVVDLYEREYEGWNVKHFYSWYRSDHEGKRGYTWVKNSLQANKAVSKAPKRGAHRKRRERSPYPGMMIHQDGSTHEQYDMRFVDEEGTQSSFEGLK